MLFEFIMIMISAVRSCFLVCLISWSSALPHPSSELFDLMKRKEMPSALDSRQNLERDNTIVKSLDIGISDLEAFPEMTQNTSKA